ncbi:MAG: trypsin-like peptidase domain-containing protein, partial [Lentisphaeria bacterium]
LANLGNSFADVSEKVIPSVVVITNIQRVNRRNTNDFYSQLPPEFRRFFGLTERNNSEQNSKDSRLNEVGRGSGIIIEENGYIVTNYHVIKDADFLEVRLKDGSVFNNSNDKDSLKVVGIDVATDLAVLKINSDKKLQSATFADSNKIRVGEWAIAVGAPFNLDYSVTVGVVSQKGRYDVRMNALEDFIQTDASINPGNSGGPLLNINGEVMGINNFIITGGTNGSIGLGFAISSNLAKQISAAIIKNGKVIRPWLGIVMSSLTNDMKKNLKVENGVFISEVVKGDPADQAGIKAGDIIKFIGDKAINSTQDLQLAILSYQPSDVMKIKVNRDGKIIDTNIKVRAREDNDDNNLSNVDESDLLNTIGLEIKEEKKSVIVTSVNPNLTAYAAGLREGATILKINRTNVHSIHDVVEALKNNEGNYAMFLIEYRGRKYYTNVQLN